MSLLHKSTKRNFNCQDGVREYAGKYVCVCLCVGVVNKNSCAVCNCVHISFLNCHMTIITTGATGNFGRKQHQSSFIPLNLVSTCLQTAINSQPFSNEPKR